MPGKTTNGGSAAVDLNLCRRCQVDEPCITVRGQSLCSGCFRRYVSTKVVKRMETCFRVRDSTPGHPRTLLLPLSMGYCSNALLHVLSQHLKGQIANTGRTGYQIHVIHIHESDEPTTSSTAWAEIQQRYPEHKFSTQQLSEAMTPEIIKTLRLPAAQDPSGTTDDQAFNSAKAEQFSHIMSSLSSATSRADVLQILRQRLVAQFAKENKCEGVLWGHSTTRLAERVLAETAKGRGSSLPWLVEDGESPLGVPSYYPMRELLSKELVAFASLADPVFNDLVISDEAKPAVSTKNTTIDDLMKQYFATVENDYPSIVANVVRTTGKLQSPSLAHIEAHCELCEMPLDGQAPDRSRLCYGCIRALPIDPL